MAEHNDKRYALAAYLVPTIVHTTVARALGFQPEPVIAVFLDKKEKTFSTMLVPQ